MKILLLSALLFADSTIQYESSSTGYRGMGAYESKGTRMVSGVKAREEANTRFTGAILGRLGGKKGKDKVTIIRVDQDKIWTLDPKKKTYTEAPITAKPQADEDEKEEKPAKEEKPTHRIKSATASVKKTGEKKEINGFKANKYEALLNIVVEEIETKQTAEYKMTSEIWAAPWSKELRKAHEDEAAFQKAFLAKVTSELPARDKERFGLDTARLVLSAAGPEVEKALTKLTRELGSIDGYPVLTETAWHLPAAAKTAAKEEKEEDTSISDAAGSGSVGGAAASLLGGFAKKAAKKKMAESAKENEGKPAFSIRTEVKKVETGVAVHAFDVPEGYKKKD